MVISQEYVGVPVGDRVMRTFVACPRVPGRYPGVVFYSDIFQLTDSTLRWCMRLAGYGFVVAAPEIYHRIEPAGTVLEFDDEGKRRGQADADATPVVEFDDDIRAALDWLEADDRVADDGLGVTGHCTGGHLGFRAAVDRRVRATALWYPTGLHDGKLGRDADAGSLGRASEIRGEVLLIFGTDDPHTPEEGRAVIKRGLEEAGVSSAGACTTLSTPSGATLGRAMTRRRPTLRSPRPLRSSRRSPALYPLVQDAVRRAEFRRIGNTRGTPTPVMHKPRPLASGADSPDPCCRRGLALVRDKPPSRFASERHSLRIGRVDAAGGLSENRR